jgi:alcohol dehydrogenase
MKETMKGLVYHGNKTISLDDLPMPKIEKPDDVIGRVTASAICTSDIHIVQGHAPAKAPLVLGHEFCIEVVEAGEAVKEQYKVGEHYVVAPLSFCGQCDMCKLGRVGRCENGGGFGIFQSGAQAEYIRVSNSRTCMYKVPDGVKDEEVLLVPDMLATGLFGIKQAGVQKGDTVAVIGLGPVGFCTCELLKKIYECNVIAITRQQESLEKAKRLGIADEIVNATDSEMVGKVLQITGKGAPIVIETTGNQTTMETAFNIVAYGGMISTVAVFGGPISVPFHTLVYKNARIAMGIQRAEGIADMIQYVKDGVIDTTFALTHKVPLNDIIKGYELFGLNGKRTPGCIKVVVTPWEDR